MCSDIFFNIINANCSEFLLYFTYYSAKSLNYYVFYYKQFNLLFKILFIILSIFNSGTALSIDIPIQQNPTLPSIQKKILAINSFFLTTNSHLATFCHHLTTPLDHTLTIKISHHNIHCINCIVPSRGGTALVCTRGVALARRLWT